MASVARLVLSLVAVLCAVALSRANKPLTNSASHGVDQASMQRQMMDMTNKIKSMDKILPDMSLNVKEMMEATKPTQRPKRTASPVTSGQSVPLTVTNSKIKLQNEVLKLQDEITVIKNNLIRTGVLSSADKRKFNILENEIRDYQVNTDDIEQSSQKIEELRKGLQNLTDNLKESFDFLFGIVDKLYKDQLPDNTADDILSKNFKSAEENLKQIDDPLKISLVVKKVLNSHSANFDLLLEFAKGLKDPELKLSLCKEMHYEMSKIRDSTFFKSSASDIKNNSVIENTTKPDLLATPNALVLGGCFDKNDPLFSDPEFQDLDVKKSNASQTLTVDRLDGEKMKKQKISLVTNIAKCNKRIVGYYTSWGEKSIYAAHLKRITHVIYAFIEMNADGSVTIGSADRASSADPEKDKRKTLKRLRSLMNLASEFPHLQVLFSVGGWANSQYFSGMAASPDKRMKFVASVIKLIEEFGFGGVDIDWVYPVTGGANEGIAEDKQNYVTFMKELRAGLDEFASKVQRSKKFLISFVSAAGQWILGPGFDLPGLLEYADFVNVMSYDYFGAWESKWGAYTGPPAPLFSGSSNVDSTMKYYACKSKTPHKINMGVPFYGRFWKNVGGPIDESDHMWRMATAVNGKFEGGFVPWHEIESQYLKNGFEKHFHEQSKTPYAWSPSTKTFLGYEDIQSLTLKMNYVAEKNLGGLMIWTVEYDDDNLSLLNVTAYASLCGKTDPNLVNYKCS